MEITNRKTYKVKTDSKFLIKKYGKEFLAWVEGTDTELFGNSWGNMNGNWACMNYGMRSGMEGLPFSGKVYYCKISSLENTGIHLGELLHESELANAEEVK